MAGEAEMRVTGADAGKEVVHIRRSRRAEGEAVAGKACFAQHPLKQVERAAFLGCDGGTADEVLQSATGSGAEVMAR